MTDGAHRPDETAIPVAISSLVGRADDIESLSRAVVRDRLVTITGLPGVGKSRVAAEVAHRVSRSFPRILWLESLDALQARVRPEERALLVVDDLSVDPANRATVSAFLSARPAATMLVSSRGRVGIPGERAHELAPLGRPTTERDKRGRLDESTSLFLERLRETAPQFEVSPENALVVRELCEILDGIPAAIEAAAAAHEVLGLESLLQFVQRGGAFAAARHALGRYVDQTVEEIENAPPAERRAWTLLAAYRGFLAVDCWSEEVLDRDVVEAFVRLAESHELIRGSSSGSSYATFRVPTLRRCVLAQRTGEPDARAEAGRLRNDHLWSALAHAASGWFGHDQARHIAHLNMHRRDLEALLATASDDPRSAGQAVEGICSLRYYWRMSGMGRFASECLERALAYLPEAQSLRARAMSMLSYLRVFEEDVRFAENRVREGLAFASSIGDETSRSESALSSAILSIREHTDLGGAERAMYELLEGTVRPEDLGERYWMLSLAMILRNELSVAETLTQTSLRQLNALGDAWGAAYTHLLVSLIAQRRGELGPAFSAARDAFDVFIRSSDSGGLRSCLRQLAAVLQSRGDTDRAVLVFGAATQCPTPAYALSTVFGEGFEEAATARLGRQRMTERMSRGASLSWAEVRNLLHGGELPVESDSSTLTSREQEIAALVAAGHQNGRIAEELVLSRRTVEGHVQRILTKLGFHSRAQVAVWFTEHRQAQSALAGNRQFESVLVARDSSRRR